MDLLSPGATCWRTARAGRVSVLVDVAAYFAALRRAALRAQRALYIVGWDVDSRTPLSADPSQAPDDGYPLRLLDFLNALLSDNPELEVYVLAWDFSMIYALERELLSSLKFGWRAHARLHFVLDDHHPVGASHHQKLTVIDDRVAFCGGMDLTIRRWDTSEHRAGDPRRRDPRGMAYAPLHDVQLAVDGDAAAALGELARARWEACTGQRLAPAAAPRARALFRRGRRALPPADAWPDDIPVDVRDVEVGIARTAPALDPGEPDAHEVLALNLAAIAAARHSIFIENQYLTAAAIVDALAQRLAERDGPEVVIILPRLECGWMEQSSMGILRARMLARLERADRHRRLHIYYPRLPDLAGAWVNVHSKVLIVDNRLLKIGSSNLSNRSMGLDTECDLAVEAPEAPATPEAERAAYAIAALRLRLLGEHLDLAPDELARRIRACGSIAAAIEARRGHARCLEPLESDPAGAAVNLALLDGLVVDPERPMDADAFMERLVPEELQRPARRSLYGMVAVIALLMLAAALWRFSDVRELASAERLGQWLHAMRNSPLLPAYVLAVYVLAAGMFVPITILIGGAALVFDPARSFAFSMGGALASAALSYAVGRKLGRQTLRRLWGSRFQNWSAPIRRRGFRTVLAARLLPLGNFTAINLAAGALHVPFRAYMAGNTLGLLPGVLGLSLFASGLERTLREPTAGNVALSLVALVALGYGIVRLKRALSARSPAGARLMSPQSEGGLAE